MGKKTEKWRRIFVFMLALSMLMQNLSLAGAKTVKAEEAGSKISISAEKITAKAAGSHGAELAVDGDTGTYWQSIPSNGEGDNLKRMYDHNHYIDITLDGTYNLSQVKIFNVVNGSYNNYYVYASVDGENYDKIISKTSNDPATAEGDSYTLGNVSASYLRLNMAYNSDAFATNLSEIEVYGTKISDTVEEPARIQVEDWEGSKWQVEWDKFETDQAYANQKVLTEMSNLVGRVLGDQWKASFRFEFRSSLEEGKDIFEVKDGTDGTIVIRGNSGLAMASGFNYYLKNYVNINYNPLYASNTALKKIVPVGEKIVKEAQFDVRYALNFCTYSYTMSFWNWDEYEEFLDWCAMNGINLVLDIVGQEEVLRQTLVEFKYTDEEIKDYICGPAYFAWFYMQNLYSVGGPLPNAWFEQRTELARQIHDRMQTYGISPVIQGFAGQVPETFADKNEGAVLIATGDWSGFTRPTMIRTYLTDAELAAGNVNYFSKVAEVFYEKQKNVFGNVSHYYATDPFHEGGNTGGLDTATIFSEVQKEMLKSDEDAIWVMQQWQGNLDSKNISKLDKSQTLPLVLHADMKTYEKDDFENWEMQWVYCMLHDFGGRMGLDGEVPVIAVDPIETFHNTNYMAGIGITAEALENSPVVYELMFDTNWSKDPIDYYAWLKKYSERRSGGESKSLWKAWKILLNTAYADKGITYQGAAETVINARPADNFGSASTWGHSNILYDKAELDQALLILAENYEAFQASPAFQYDLADVAEQVLCNAAVEYHSLMVQAKNEGDLQKFEQLSTAFLRLIDLSDQILSTTDEFMLGTWIEASRKMITDADDWTKDLFEFNARALVTTWAGERPCNNGLKDYSNRKWAGLTSSFYKERWAIWIRNRIADLKGEERNAADAKAESNWFLWEYQWVNRKSDDNNGEYAFATEPSGANLAELAQQAYDQFSFTNLEKNTGGTAQETVNIAKGKSAVTTSSTQSGSLQNITDGDTGTEWIAAGAGPHTVEIDLEAVYDVSRITLSGPQRAGDIPYTWKVEYYNPNTAAWVLLEENTDYSMSSNTEIDVSGECTASKIRVTMSTSDAQSYPLEITEITVNGTEVETGYENIALGLTPTATAANNTVLDGTLSIITNGNTNDLWSPTGSTWSDSKYPVDIELDLQRLAYVDSIGLYFEKAGLPFVFYVTVTGEDGQEQEVFTKYKAHTGTMEESSFSIEVKQEIRKVNVHITGKNAAGLFQGVWPAIAELIVMGSPEENQKPDFTDKSVSAVTVSGGNASGKVLDGNKTTYDLVSTNQEIIFDLGKTNYLSHVNLTFEKAGLGLKYQVIAEDAKGTRTVISDKSNSLELLTDATVRIPVDMDAKKIIFIHMGNNGQGNAYAAETRLYEFEAFGVAKAESGISVEPTAAAGLLNGNTYTVSANTPIVFSLESQMDIDMISVLRADGETKKLCYKAEYYEAESGAWKTFADFTESESTMGESFAVTQEKVSSVKIRLTFAENISLSGIGIYGSDYAGVVAERIRQIQTILNGCKYGDSKGDYRESAKTAAEAVLSAAGDASITDSKSMQEWLDKVNDALDVFYETGVVYLNRDVLLAAMADAVELMEKQIKYECLDGMDDLQAAYNSARTAYETYEMTQSAIDAAQSVLDGVIQTVKAAVGSNIDAAEVLEAKDDLQQFVTEMEVKEEKDYEAESWEEYEAALTAVNQILNGVSASQEEIAAAKFRLYWAINHLTNLIKVETITVSAEGGKTALKVNETVQLAASVSPDNATDASVAWSSGTPSFATVTDQGLVTAKAEGTVTITATAKDKSGVTGKITLTITKNSTGDTTNPPGGTTNPPGGNTNPPGDTTNNPGSSSETPGGSKTDTKNLPAVGTVYKTTTLQYKITKSTESAKTVTVQKSVKKNPKKIVIPATVSIEGYSYQVTEIAAKAFRKNTKLTKMTIGANITKIGKQAFYGCKKLKTVTITSKGITGIGKKAFVGISKKAKITVPKQKFKNYKTLFKTAKTAQTVTIKKK